MTYVDGFVVAVPSDKKDAYVEQARKALPIFKEYGALRMVEAWGDDVPDGKLTDFRMAVKAEATETVVFSWIEWPDKTTRDAGMRTMMTDERMSMEGMVFDGKRMIYGGFAVMLDE
ncbi:MAG: DUF1428 domain-containing protein [Methylobacterium sp.]|nr:MAG: DUF1428 domain-containing protein [Methylobacterium sp.]